MISYFFLAILLAVCPTTKNPLVGHYNGTLSRSFDINGVAVDATPVSIGVQVQDLDDGYLTFPGAFQSKGKQIVGNRVDEWKLIPHTAKDGTVVDKGSAQFSLSADKKLWLGITVTGHYEDTSVKGDKFTVSFVFKFTGVQVDTVNCPQEQPSP